MIINNYFYILYIIIMDNISSNNMTNNDTNNDTNNNDSIDNINDDKESNNKYKELNMGDEFWTENYNVLFEKDKIFLFIPTDNMTLIEKLNAIFRLSIILSIALYLFTSNYNYLYILT